MRKEVLRLYGPLFFWTVMFIIGSAIQYSSFSDSLFWLDVPQGISLWATGILFTLTMSEQTYHRAKLVPRVSRDPGQPSYSVAFDIDIADNPGFDPIYLFLFLAGIAAWIGCLLLGGHARAAYIAAPDTINIAYLLAPIAYSIAASVVTMAIRTLREAVS
jgi:hypothetical protein